MPRALPRRHASVSGSAAVATAPDGRGRECGVNDASRILECRNGLAMLGMAHQFRAQLDQQVKARLGIALPARLLRDRRSLLSAVRCCRASAVPSGADAPSSADGGDEVRRFRRRIGGAPNSARTNNCRPLPSRARSANRGSTWASASSAAKPSASLPSPASSRCSSVRLADGKAASSVSTSTSGSHPPCSRMRGASVANKAVGHGEEQAKPGRAGAGTGPGQGAGLVEVSLREGCDGGIGMVARQAHHGRQLDRCRPRQMSRHMPSLPNPGHDRHGVRPVLRTRSRFIQS